MMLKTEFFQHPLRLLTFSFRYFMIYAAEKINHKNGDSVFDRTMR